MKAWFQKLSISNDLDNRRPIPPAKVAESRRSVEARRFACQALEQGLKSQPPALTSPPGLHEAIMREIQTAARPATARQLEWIPRWQLAASCVLAVGLGMILVRHFPGSPPDAVPAAATPSLALAGSALDLGNRLVCTAPSAVLAPLAAESKSLDRDLARAGNFIIASLP